MAIKGSGSPMEAVDEYFDMLIKSRFIEISHSTDTKHVPLGSLIKPYVAQRCEDCDYPVLSITRHQGLILQSDRFKKEIASRDKSQYKVIPRNVLVVAFPIDEGLLCAQQIVDNGLVSPAYKTYKIDEKIVFPRILELILRSDKSISYYLSKMRGTTLRRRTLPEEEFQSMLIDLPSMSMQKHFIKMLEQIDVVKIICKQIFQLFDDLVKSRFNEMFGGHTELSRWPCYSVADVCSVKVGVVIKPAQYYTLEKDGIKTFRSLNIGENCINDKEWVYFTKEGNECNKRTVLKENDVIVARSGLPGVACVIPKEYEGCNAVDVIIATPNTSRVNPYYLAYYTNSPHGKQQIVSRGAAQQHFNVGSYEKVTLALPPLELQNEFVDFVKQVDKSKFEVVQSLLRLKSKYIRTETPSKRTDCDL